jgi:hypothetical protein
MSDISENARTLARAIDRLPPGQSYAIHITRPGVPSAPWRYEISKLEKIQHHPPRKIPPPLDTE